jgi:hypothetical protein
MTIESTHFDGHPYLNMYRLLEEKLFIVWHEGGKSFAKRDGHKFGIDLKTNRACYLLAGEVVLEDVSIEDIYNKIKSI